MLLVVRVTWECDEFRRLKGSKDALLDQIYGRRSLALVLNLLQQNRVLSLGDLLLLVKLNEGVC